ncbi:unnamed protein product [Leptosia nina]|uniref:Uncharacterized protein n=1 Tax=Leptosia nina TaxID=320188 RepID=A0AAV1JC91_9NEOP
MLQRERYKIWKQAYNNLANNHSITIIIKRFVRGATVSRWREELSRRLGRRGLRFEPLPIRITISPASLHQQYASLDHAECHRCSCGPVRDSVSLATSDWGSDIRRRRSRRKN